MARDFKAEAIARRRLEAEQRLKSRPYEQPLKQYQYKKQPEGMDTAAWRHLCECRFLLYALPNQEQRRRFLAKVEEARGKQARLQLENDARRIWQQEKDSNR